MRYQAHELFGVAKGVSKLFLLLINQSAQKQKTDTRPTKSSALPKVLPNSPDFSVNQSANPSPPIFFKFFKKNKNYMYIYIYNIHIYINISQTRAQTRPTFCFNFSKKNYMYIYVYVYIIYIHEYLYIANQSANPPIFCLTYFLFNLFFV